VRIQRAAERRSTPWKNGGGLTFEVASFPEGSTLDTLDWRISLAEVRLAGAFSLFPGIDRKLALLDGRLSLCISGRNVIELSPGSGVLAFPGDIPTSAQPLSPQVTDFNVMTRRGRFTSRVLRRAVATSETLNIAGSDVTVVIALGCLGVDVAGNRIELLPRDALLLSWGDASSVELHATESNADYFLVEILAMKSSAATRGSVG
jgi:environmental stress-induced protein Ves